MLAKTVRLAVETDAGPSAAAFAHWPSATLVFDETRTCRFATDRARRLFSFADVTGMGASALFSEWETAPNLAVDSGQDEPAVSVICHADGRQFRCEAVQERELGLCLTLTDITRHVREAELAARDSLTGLPQRGAFKERLIEALDLAFRAERGVAVHYVDLDRFKTINDTLGHAIGDALLVKVAERLSSTLNKGDILARFGGDEFVLVQTNVDGPAMAETLAARVTDLIGRSYVIRGHMLNIGASVGIALSPSDGADAETLLLHADLAAYRAKADGRGVFRFFEPSMNTRMQTRRNLESDLRRALALRQFHLNYQPLIQLDSNRVCGFEALLRWNHPERGAVSPVDFIPLAEEIGLIIPLGEWTLRTACREAMTWPGEPSVAVNISPVQFRDGKLTQLVTSVLAQSGLSPQRLELEITEGALLHETNLVVSTLHAMRDLGVRISMDDFGTGYSSLSYLRKFPFDKIKIDQSFVRGLGDNADCEAIVRAVTKLGRSLGMHVTAEGVETSAQFDAVRIEGCTEVQGYLTGRPLTAESILPLLQDQIAKGPK